MRRGKKGGGRRRCREIRKVKDNNEYLVRPSMFILHCKKRGKVGREREKAKERERENYLSITAIMFQCKKAFIKSET